MTVGARDDALRYDELLLLPAGTSTSAARVAARPGPALLSGLLDGPSLPAHRRRFGHLDDLGLDDLAARLDLVGLRGRGGAGFPFARKLRAAADSDGRATVAVNLSEGEPGSSKDAALAVVAPHLVLDGAVRCARALRAREVHLILPADRPGVARAVRQAVAERDDQRVRWRLHEAAARFVSGQARAVVELMSGRDNLPVTSWQPEAISGYRGRPTLLSNAETFAHVGVTTRTRGAHLDTRGQTSDGESGTTLLTVHTTSGHAEVVEVPLGWSWSSVLDDATLAGPVLVGGYHGTWVPEGGLTDLEVDRAALSEHGIALGAGVVLSAGSACPLHVTARLVGYLAGQSARRCGPCFNGLPALADALATLDAGRAALDRIEELAALVAGRGACAHPDGTVRLVRSLLAHWPQEAERHAAGWCTYGGTVSLPALPEEWAR